MGRLLVEGPLTPEKLGQGARAVLLAETGESDLDALEQRLEICRAEAANLIEAVLAGAGVGPEAGGGPAREATR